VLLKPSNTYQHGLIEKNPAAPSEKQDQSGFCPYRWRERKNPKKAGYNKTNDLESDWSPSSMLKNRSQFVARGHRASQA